MQRLDYILQLPQPTEFVQSLPSQEFYLLLKDIGTADACALLDHASADQIQGVFDIDLWSGYELRLERWLTWLDLARSVNLETALRMVSASESELIQLLMTREATVHASDLDIDTVPDELQVYPSPDGAYFVTIPREHPMSDGLMDLMKLLWASDMPRMLQIFDSCRFELASQVEEHLLAFRRARLGDMGFSDPEDAMALYSALDHRELRQEMRASLETMPAMAPHTDSHLATAMVLRGLEAPNLLSAAMASLDEGSLEVLGEGMTRLVNKVVMARTRDLSHVGALQDAGQHATALVNLGLSHLCDEQVGRGSEVLRRLSAERLFRTGYSLCLELATPARRLRRRAGATVGLHLLDTPTHDTLEGVASNRPEFFKGLDTPGEVGFRDFKTIMDLERVRVLLKDAEAIVVFFETRLGFSPDALANAPLKGLDREERNHIRFSTLFRTGIARLLMEEAFHFTPLSREEMLTFLGFAFEGQGSERRLSQKISSLPESLAADAPAPLIQWMTRALEELALAMGRVEIADIESEYAGELLLVAREG